MYFSIYMESSPNDDFASDLAILMADLISDSSLTILRPLPPPPAVAFSMTG